MFSSFVTYESQLGFILLGVRRYTSSDSIICIAVGLDVTKYENMPHSDSGIRKSVSGKYIE
jgi:hypothetical protein